MDDYDLNLEETLLLQAYLDNELTPDEREALIARLAREPALTAVLHQWRALSAELNTLPEPALNRDLTADVLARLEASAPLPARVLVAQAALALLLALLVWPLLTALPTLRLAFPDWTSLMGLAADEFGRGWQTAYAWMIAVWAEWTAVWQGMGQVWPSLSWLLPLALAAALAWALSMRAVWHSTPATHYTKG
jgi:anti-sigma factor RsiW